MTETDNIGKKSEELEMYKNTKAVWDQQIREQNGNDRQIEIMTEHSIKCTFYIAFYLHLCLYVDV